MPLHVPNDRFEITIKRIRYFESEKPQEIKSVERPYTTKESEDSGHHATQAAARNEPYSKTIYERIQVPYVGEEKVEIYTQIIDAPLNLIAVINAVNQPLAQTPEKQS